MKEYIEADEWKIIERGFRPEYNQISESLCSIGNARYGQRANFEEGYSGESLSGSYIAGIYYPDKTRVGWWKNGYPEYFAKVLNSCNWIGISIYLNDEALDIARSEVLDFTRCLDMKKGLLTRICKLRMENGIELEIQAERFYSFKNQNLALLNYKIKILKGTGKIKICPFIDFDIRNQDSNYEENFWHDYQSHYSEKELYLSAKTKKTNFSVGLASDAHVLKNGHALISKVKQPKDSKLCQIFESDFDDEDIYDLTKYVCIVSSFYEAADKIQSSSLKQLTEAKLKSFLEHRLDHENIWAEKWHFADIKIDGDIKAQQGIRFNIFHLNQTYDGSDSRLNIGPKGFTGEKYGGSTYWDTEAYCLPFYLFSAEKSVSRNLLMYRYQHLQKAVENAEKLGFNTGAALYPMVTMNGEECHNEWEITFEEIHRNGAIAYAIYDYTNHFNDYEYLDNYGIHVLIAISKFWSQRVQFSKPKSKYVILGVTGPNEYENNVNNNWYTNYLAKWCLEYTTKQLSRIKKEASSQYEALIKHHRLKTEDLEHWTTIAHQIYFPFDDELGVYLQQDGFLDKDLSPVSTLDKKHLPINQKWSWDRILRSPYIKQADVLQGFYFFQDDFSTEELKRHFLFYEPLTVHESSLSPCIHSILASRLNMEEKAYEMYLRTARLDIDDYNNDTEDGLHITSMGGTWLAIVKGFAGARVIEGKFHFKPQLPKTWKSLSFNTRINGSVISVTFTHSDIEFHNESDTDCEVYLNDTKYMLKPMVACLINL